MHHVRASVRSTNRARGRVSAGLMLAGVRLWCRLAVALVRHRPALVYAFLSQNRTGFLRDGMVILTARAAGARVVAHLHGGNFHRFFADSPPVMQRLIRRVLGACRCVLLSGNSLRAQFAGLVPESRLQVMHNPVDWRAFDAALSRRAVPGACRMLFIGHLSVAKGFADLLAAVPEVLDEVEGAAFEFLGEWLDEERNIRHDEHGRALVHDAAKLRATWTHLVERYPGRLLDRHGLADAEKVRVITEADVFVLPSHSEGFPMAVLEAMAAALPLVLTPVGALREMLSEANAVFVDPGDPRGLARALIDLARDPERREELGRANRALVARTFTPEAVSRSLSACFRECLN